MTEEEKWKEELQQDPTNAFLQNLISKNYGAAN